MIAETKAAAAAESPRSNIPSSWSAPAAGAGPEEEGDGEDEPWCEGVTPPERSTRAAAAVIQVGREPLEQPTIAPDWLGNPRPRRLRSRSGIRAARVAMRPRLRSLPTSLPLEEEAAAPGIEEAEGGEGGGLVSLSREVL